LGVWTTSRRRGVLALVQETAAPFQHAVDELTALLLVSEVEGIEGETEVLSLGQTDGDGEGLPAFIAPEVEDPEEDDEDRQ
jgi:hypothetical protein